MNGAMNPLVSILIPAFNSQEWIADTLRSALAQTWERKEIIVVDDGSGDQTLAIAKTFASKDVLVVTQENQGAATARNKALSLSQGDYIQWLDADDVLGEDKITRQLERAQKADDPLKLLSAAWGTFMYRLRRAKFGPTRLWSDQAPLEWLLHKMHYNLHMQTATWLVSRALTDAAGPWDTRLSFDDDGEYFCRVLLQSTGVLFVQESKVYYRLPAMGNLSYIGQSDRKLASLLLSMRLHMHYLRSLEESDRVRCACLRYMQTWFPYFYPERSDLMEELQQTAKSLGGQLSLPPLSWKYVWIHAIFGQRWARQAQQFLPSARWAIVRTLDRLLSNIENKVTRSHRAV